MRSCVVCGGALPARRRRYCNELCAARGDAEVQRVKWHTNASLALGRPASLDIDVWLEYLRHFGWMCAYCQGRPATDLDHFIPPAIWAGQRPAFLSPAARSVTTAKLQRPEYQRTRANGSPGVRSYSRAYRLWPHSIGSRGAHNRARVLSPGPCDDLLGRERRRFPQVDDSVDRCASCPWVRPYAF